MGIIQTIRDELPNIKAEPVSFVLSVVALSAAISVGAWAVLNWTYSQQIIILNLEISYWKDAAGGAKTPEELRASLSSYAADIESYKRIGSNTGPADLEKKFADLQSQIDNLEGNTVSDEQASAMDRSWQTYSRKDQEQLSFGYTQDCIDSERFARSLASIFVQTGWRKVSVMSKERDDGIIDLKVDGPDVDNAISSITSALIAARISVGPADTGFPGELYIRLPHDLFCP